jgi:hypothetical protein
MSPSVVLAISTVSDTRNEHFVGFEFESRSAEEYAKG